LLIDLRTSDLRHLQLISIAPARLPCFAAEFLGFLNKTCNAGTQPGNYGKTAGPVIRSANYGTQWKQWTLKAVSAPAANGAVDVTIANYYPRSGTPRCLGYMVAEKPQACSVTDSGLADRVHIHPKQPEGGALATCSMRTRV